MGRLFFLALLVAGLLLQGAVAATADLQPEQEVSSHCAGSEPVQDDGDCCDDVMSTGCAVHCQAAEASFAFVLSPRNTLPTFQLAADDRANPSPDYLPDLRPPIV